MIADRNRLKEYGLELFVKDMDNIELQYLNLIYDPMFDVVCEKWVYDKNIGMMEWKCAICGCDMLVDRKRDDVSNFLCKNCNEVYGKGDVIDHRIVESRTRMFRYMEDKLYEELEDMIIHK